MFKTLVYADVFDYPLRAAELVEWQIAGDRPRPELTGKTGKFYHLKGRQALAVLRRRRQHFSHLKLKRARLAAGLLKLIPWIKLIAVTGALAMNNSDQNDDIDLMIVTQANRLWLSRLLATILLLPQLRQPHQRFLVSDKICLNLWLDETALSLPRNQRNLYTAHEVVQVKPILDRDYTYLKFIIANLWLKNYLPNWKG